MACVRKVFGHRCVLIALLALLGIILVLQTSAAHGQAPDSAWETEALELLEEILERPEFQWEEERETLLQRLWMWLARRLFNLIPDVAPSGRIVSTVLAALGGAALLSVLGYIVLRIRRQVKENVEFEPLSDESQWRDADHALADAQSVAEQGDYRLALRYLYLSSLLSLHERGLITYDRTRTNLEYLQSVKHRPQLAETLGKIVEVFDRSWYGLRAPDYETYKQFIGYVQTLRELR